MYKIMLYLCILLWYTKDKYIIIDATFDRIKRYYYYGAKIRRTAVSGTIQRKKREITLIRLKN